MNPLISSKLICYECKHLFVYDQCLVDDYDTLVRCPECGHLNYYG
jgi:DNA-directed RNA polymerase subunit RPC12/RpoP